jgi:RNA polymerase sigma-54 factor
MVDMINQEMEENPLLEESTLDDFPEEEVPSENDTLMTLQADEIKAVEHTSEITGEGDGREDFDWDNYLEDYGPVGMTYEKRDDDSPSWDNLLTKVPSLADHLMWQLKLSLFSELEMRIGEQIIGNIDQNGYLAATIDEIAAQENVEPAAVEELLYKIQTFDPPGIAARDLKECLLIQARMLGINNPIIERIICDHLKELEIKHYALIARKLKVPLPDVMEAVSYIGNMDPKPGSAFQQERVQTLIPDVYVVKSGNDYKIILNDDGLPRLRISNFYREIMAGLEGSMEGEMGKRYIKERVQSATWLIKSIQQRQKTIYKVAESIVRFQIDYFNKGISYLKPLVLRDVALDVDMHESTISRVVTNKYMQTPSGLFELKYFFSSGISTTGGDAIASKSVKEEIRKLINEEDPKKPLSDSEIVERLAASGINIARRTVAKYREMMNVLPSSRRKKYF